MCNLSGTYASQQFRKKKERKRGNRLDADRDSKRRAKKEVNELFSILLSKFFFRFVARRLFYTFVDLFSLLAVLRAVIVTIQSSSSSLLVD